VAAEYELAVARCDDVYSAVAELACRRRCALVVGRLAELTKENGQFFHVAARNEARCAVLLEAAERRSVLTAVRAGAWLMDSADELGAVVETWLTGPGHPPSLSRPAREEFRATEAELDALLGQDVDG